MNCCRSQLCEGTNRFFSRWSKRYAKDFRKKGPDKIQTMILRGVGSDGSSFRHILDIGCGVGSLHLTLLTQGAQRATGIEVSIGMLEEARKLSIEFGVKDRVEYVAEDFVQVADTVDRADITLLDKVVCCYDNPKALLAASLGKTTGVYALSHPREHILIKLTFKLQIFINRLLRTSFHPYWHDWGVLRGMILSSGFALRYEDASFVWRVLVFERTPGR